MEDLFEPYDAEFLKFDRIENPKHRRPDICAFLMLDELFPGTSDMITWAGHEEIGLSIAPDKLAEKATPEQLRDLHRCGVRSGPFDSLVMFV
jgi:hypothetical protein